MEQKKINEQRLSTTFYWLHLLVLLGGLHHDEVPLVVQPFMKVVVVCLFETQIPH